MANIPIRDIPGAVVASPDPTNLIPMDNGSIMQKTTIANAVNVILPLASQAEASAGVDNVKRMSPLRTKQAIDAQTPAIVNVAITALNLGTMSQEDASDYTPTSGLAAVALSNDYADLSNLPTLGTAAATDASDYATAAQGSLADSAVQPGNAALVPAGGTTGQVLAKTADTDYATNWTDPEAVALPDGAVTTPKLANDAVTFDKVQNVATARILGRNSAGTGDIEELSALPATVSVAVSNLPGAALLNSGVAVASTAGTAIDFTGIPPWAKRVTLLLSSVSTTGVSQLLVQLGDAGGIETTGYLGSASIIGSSVITVNTTAGMPLNNASSLNAKFAGGVTINKIDGNTWVAFGTLGRSGGAATNVFGSTKTLSDTLTQLRITTASGTETFVEGTVNILWE